MEKHDIIEGYKNVDASQADFLVKFLEKASQQPDILDCFATQLKWLDIQQGNHILDIGCGIGIQAKEMAKLVGAKGKVIGTDVSAAMVEVSKSRHAGSNLPLEFLIADALHQPFSNELFDRIRLERVLMYISDTNAAITEFKRLLKPGGKLIIYDANWDALMIPHSNVALTRKIIAFISDSFPKGRIGLELLHYFKDLGFKDVKIKAFTYSTTQINLFKYYSDGILKTGISKGIFTESEIADWWAVLEEDEKNEKSVIGNPGFLVMGTK